LMRGFFVGDWLGFVSAGATFWNCAGKSV
jgi:hypothetical protein